MALLFQSDKVSLFNFRLATERCQDELWRLFQKTTVEASQASSPGFTSFADECLFCARIVAKEPNPQDPMEETRATPEAPTEQSSPLPTTTSNWHTPRQGYQEDGFIYLHAGPANFSAGEINIGVIMKEEMQHRGYAQAAVQLVLRYAFEELQFHRVLASVLDTPFKDRAQRLFIGSGFVYEGMKRRALYHREGGGVAGIWKDVTYLATLDTEWALRSTRRRDCQIIERPVSVWDEMFARHSREREELVKWEESHGRLTRTSSMETLKENARKAVPEDPYYLSDNASSIGEPSVSGSAPPSPPPNLVVTWDDAQMQDADIYATERSQRWEGVVETTYAAWRNRQEMGSSLLEPSPPSHLLALPSIPSTRMSSQENVQSPLTIPSPSSAGSSPPSSSWPLSAPSPVHSSWSDSEDEASSPSVPSSPPVPPIDVGIRYPYYLAGLPGLRVGRSLSRSASSSGSDSWSDAQSSVWDASSSTWDLISNTSDRGPRGGE